MSGAQHGSDGSLVALGAGVGSKAERLKLESHGLSGTLREELQEEGARFSEENAQLLKFHGVYQQEDRDARQARKAAGTEKAYMFMVRSRIPGGALNAAQYLTQDDLAERYGNGSLRITTRQGFQLHGVLKGDLHDAIHEINEALLSTLAACGDVNRNVMACPAPAASAAQAQIQQVAHQIAAHLAPRATAYHEIWVDGEQVHTVAAADEQVEEPIYGATYLPRKFKIGVAAPGDNCIDTYTQDIGLAAHVDDGQLAGFTVLIGGGMGMTHGKTETYPRLATPLCFVTPEEVLEVVETIVTIQRDYGDRQNRKHARMKYLVEERGIAWFRAETERRLKRFLCSPRPVAWEGAHDHLGWHEQADGRWYLGLLVDSGRVKDTEEVRMRTALRRVMEQFAPGVRLTAQQNVLLTDIEASDRDAITALLAAHGVSTDAEAAGHVRRYALACPALPTCGLALAEAERVLPDVVAQLEETMAELGLAGEPLSVRMTGCPNGCARPYMGDIGFVGRTKDVYNIYIGGDWANTVLTTLYAPSVRLADLATTVRPLLEIWRDARNAAESFGDFAQRWGIERLRHYVEQGQTA
ncbi:MAG TPA: NADPH-dependent assimilatory sulfite reductase hemoprotein subunit [Chloroflexota bacterium]|nr:NADPH-dependent assimilatory sulfite reductase hemoprotein subunit [Chloroflexota bacterium]